MGHFPDLGKCLAQVPQSAHQADVDQVAVTIRDFMSTRPSCGLDASSSAQSSWRAVVCKSDQETKSGKQHRTAVQAAGSIWCHHWSWSRERLRGPWAHLVPSDSQHHERRGRDCHRDLFKHHHTLALRGLNRKRVDIRSIIIAAASTAARQLLLPSRQIMAKPIKPRPCCRKQ